MEEDISASLRKFLGASSQVDDLEATSPVARLADRSQVRAFRLIPEASLETTENPFAIALLAHQNGDSAPLEELATELAAQGIRLELRTFPSSSLVTGIVLVSDSLTALDAILKPR